MIGGYHNTFARDPFAGGSLTSVRL